MKHAAAVCGLLVFVGTTCCVHGAAASPSYPGALSAIVGAADPPACTVCHETLSGGFGTATKPLAVYLRSRGLTANNESALRGALAAATGENHDADNDGFADVEELRAGTDPNNPGADTRPAPEYGCGNVSGSRPKGVVVAGLLALALVCITRRRREVWP